MSLVYVIGFGSHILPKLMTYHIAATRQIHLTIPPGVRFADGDVGDQKRVMPPAAAKAIGSDYIVVGRPITAAAAPVAAYERCVAEFCD